MGFNVFISCSVFLGLALASHDHVQHLSKEAIEAEIGVYIHKPLDEILEFKRGIESAILTIK
jgi:hypothetical protein